MMLRDIESAGMGDHMTDGLTVSMHVGQRDWLVG